MFTNDQVKFNEQVKSWNWKSWLAVAGVGVVAYVLYERSTKNRDFRDEARRWGDKAYEKKEELKEQIPSKDDLKEKANQMLPEGKQRY